MGRYVGNTWREDLPSLSPADQVQGNSQPVSSGGGGGAPAAAPTAAPAQTGGAAVYQTVNGPRTAAQMMNELFAAGWGGQGEIKSVYAQTTGGAVTPSQGTTANTPGAAVPPGGGTGTFTNPTANNALLNAAQQAAYQAYLNSKLNLDTEDLAFRKAQDAFSQTVQAAGLTGTYQGQPTMAAKQQQATITGYDDQGRPTLAREAQQQQTTQQYLSLISGLKGPQDYGQYLRTIGSTPGGLRDLVSSAAGKYVPASGATTGTAPVAASLGGLVDAASTGASGGTTYGSYMNDISGLPAPNQIAPAAWNSYTDSQKKLLLGAYQSQGWNPTDVQDLYNQSLPKYTYGTGVTGTVKL